MHTVLAFETQPFATADYTIFVRRCFDNERTAAAAETAGKPTTDPRSGSCWSSTRWTTLWNLLPQCSSPTSSCRRTGWWSRAAVTVDALKKSTGAVEGLLWRRHRPDELYDTPWALHPALLTHAVLRLSIRHLFASSAQLYKTITTALLRTRAATDRYLNLLRSGGHDQPWRSSRGRRRPDAARAGCRRWWTRWTNW